MQKVQLTYWWNGHEPGDVVEVDSATAREVLGVIAIALPEPDAEPDLAPGAEPSVESDRAPGAVPSVESDRAPDAVPESRR